MNRTLVFSSFTDQELDALTKLLCKIFVTTQSQLVSLYQEIIDDFSKDGWPPHFVGRNFFRSEDQGFQEIYKLSPAIAVDLPSLFELETGGSNRSTLSGMMKKRKLILKNMMA